MGKCNRGNDMKHIVKDTLGKKDILDKSIKNNVSQKEVELSLNAKENKIYHGTRQIEQLMLDYIREGDISGIRHLFQTLSKQQPLNEGIVAETPLRQAKNIFIGLVALIGKTAAIEGGMDIEDAYRIVDIYTQECESASTVDEIYTLRYYMIMEFTERVRQCRIPQSLSTYTASAIHYINMHIYENVSLDEIAANVGISRSSLTKHFRAELGQSIGEYVTSIKIKEAQRLLSFSNMSISEIAAQLNFSSQPYFQTIFKKNTGLTPLEFKIQNQQLK